MSGTIFRDGNVRGLGEIFFEDKFFTGMIGEMSRALSGSVAYFSMQKYKSRRIRVAVNDFGHPVSTQTPRQKDRQRETHTSTQTAFDRLYYKLS